MEFTAGSFASSLYRSFLGGYVTRSNSIVVLIVAVIV